METLASYPPEVADILGLPSDNIVLIISLTATVAIFLFLLLITGSYIFAFITSVPFLFLNSMIGNVPYWIPIVYSFVGIALSATYAMYKEEGVLPPTPDYWDDYGNRIKNAYSAKFGGANTGFNEEVDGRIEVMKHNGKGFTRTIATLWLKRMHQFTECK